MGECVVEKPGNLKHIKKAVRNRYLALHSCLRPRRLDLVGGSNHGRRRVYFNSEKISGATGENQHVKKYRKHGVGKKLPFFGKLFIPFI